LEIVQIVELMSSDWAIRAVGGNSLIFLYISLKVLRNNTSTSYISFEVVAHYTVSSELPIYVLAAEEI